MENKKESTPTHEDSQSDNTEALINKIIGCNYEIETSIGDLHAGDILRIQRPKSTTASSTVISHVEITVNEALNPATEKKDPRYPRNNEDTQIILIAKGVIKIVYPFNDGTHKLLFVMYIYNTPCKDQFFYYVEHQKSLGEKSIESIVSHNLSHGSGTRD